MALKIVCISDTHLSHEKIKIPDGDVLIHAGDFTTFHRVDAINTMKFNDWLGTLPHEHKIVIAGNHDFLCEQDPELATELLSNATYLCDRGVRINGVYFWGSPYTPTFMDWAFMEDGLRIAKHWKKIPQSTQVLITHGPSFGIGDYSPVSLQHCGSPSLTEYMKNLPNLKYHVYGHIHSGYGKHGNSINAAMVDEENVYRGNTPIVITL